METKNLWEAYTPEETKTMLAFCEEYRRNLSAAKTERECVTEMIKMAEAKGYINLADALAAGKKLQAGDKVYANNKNKACALFQIGKSGFDKGMAILGAHIDSPRLDLKPNPLFENDGFAMLKTHYYGGIKKYQWVTLPLAMHGVVVKKDGTAVSIVIGEDPADPVLGITDVLPHFSKDQNQKPIAEAFTGEDMVISFGSAPLLPAEGEDKPKDPVKANVLKLLEEKYGITEDDFISAELEIVPAGPARDYGIDRSMILGYGHDDRICGFTSLAAQLDMADILTDRTLCTLLVDKEEIGSVGATGMQSRFFENTVADIMELCGCYCELKLRRCLTDSKMLSSDVSNGFDPNFAGIHEKSNAPLLNHGPVLHKYTGSRGKSGSNDATPEYIGNLRAIFAADGINFQMAELGKVDGGGGGTIAYILAQYDMDVIDVGVPLHSMHAPYEVACKPDLYETYKAYKSFLLHI